jgi:hypothetical protein
MSLPTVSNMSITDFIQTFQQETFQQLYLTPVTPSPLHKDASNGTRGRPKSDEFEDEVLAECERSLSTGFYMMRKRGNRCNEYSYVHVKKSAAIVMDTEYWDEKTCSFVKKWQLNRTTSRLRFTNKWVHGVLRRHSEKTRNIVSSSHSHVFEDAVSVHHVPDVNHIESSSSRSINDSSFAVTVEDDDHDLDDLFDVLDSMSYHEVFDAMPVHSSAETEMITLDDLLAFDFDWDSVTL